MSNDKHEDAPSALAVLLREDTYREDDFDNAVAIAAAATAPQHPILSAVIGAFIPLKNLLRTSRTRRDRLVPVIQALAEEQEKIKGEQRTISDDYVKRDEFADLVLDFLERTANQPDVARRDSMRIVLTRIIREPVTHTEHRMFIRWADELPPEAIRLLDALRGPVAARTSVQANTLLQKRARVDNIDFWMGFLANLGVFDSAKFQGVVSTGDATHILTVLGKRFDLYRRPA
jgi:hypothetical protein